MHRDFGEMLDTSPEQRRRYYELLRGLTVEQRARKVEGLCRASREMALAGIREAFPGASEDEVRYQLAVRLYGAEVAARIFPSRPGRDR